MQTKPKINRERYKKPVFELASVDDLDGFNFLEDGLYTMPVGAGRLDIISELRPGKPMVVFFGAAIPTTAERTLPWFTGTGILTGRDVSKVFVSDPSLYLHARLNLAWYVGAQQIDAQGTIVKALRTLERVARPSKVMCIGGSGGGFAALYYAAQFPDWLAVPWNPQTDIFAYNPRTVVRYLSHAWGITDLEAGRAHLQGKVVSDVFGLYDLSQPGNRVIYIQNRGDDHVQDHLLPFLQRYGAPEPASSMVGPSCFLAMEDFGDGHVPPPKEYLGTLLDGLLLDARGWADMFGDGTVGRVTAAARAAQPAAAADPAPSARGT